MENKSHVRSGLLQKQSEIAGKIDHMHRTLNELVADLDHIDNAIGIIDPSCDLSKVRSKLYSRRKSFKRWEKVS